MPHVNNLVFSIKVASWDADRQILWLEQTGFHVDEIALQLGDFYAAANYNIRGAGFPVGVKEGVEEILALFDSMSIPGSGLWSPEALVVSKEWVTVRERSRSLIRILRDSPWSKFLDEGEGDFCG